MEQINETRIETVKLTLNGELMVGGTIEYKTLIEIIEGTVGAIESIVRFSNHKSPIAFNLQPPKEKCFEISLQVVEWAGVAVSLLPNAATIKDVVAFYLEFLKIKRSLQGEEIKRENILTNENGSVQIKNNSGSVVYEDHRKITNVNLILNANADPQFNKKIDKIAHAVADSKQMDKLSFDVPSGDNFQITQKDAPFYSYIEQEEQKPDSVVGYIRRIDNKTNKGVIVIQDDGKDRNVDFEVDIKDIKLLDKIVSNLAHAEAERARVVFTGERVTDAQGKLKKIIANDVDIPDAKLGFK